MKQFSPDAKHHILLEYSPRTRGRSFASLAAKHAVAGGWRVVHRWHQQWDGTPQSLKHKSVPGRPRALSRAEVNKHVRGPILRANRAHTAISYTELLPQVRQTTGKEVTIQTLRRYGKKELKARDKCTNKRTADESKST